MSPHSQQFSTFGRGGVLAATAVVGACMLMPPATASAAPSRPSLASAAAVNIPSTCRAAATVVRPDTTLTLGVVQGNSARLYSTGVKLGYTPKAIAYLGLTTSAGATVDRFFAVHPGGDLRRIAVTERPKAAGGSTVSVTDVQVGSRWGGIRQLVSSGPYLYGLTTTGAFTRYAITKGYGVVGAGTIAEKGWGGVRSLAYGGWWNLGSGRQGDDIVALTSSGAVKAYVVPRDKPTNVTGHTLKSKGWQSFTHLAVGECSTGRARVLAGVKANGDVYAYLDGNADDQRGSDIVAGARVARDWTGRVAD